MSRSHVVITGTGRAGTTFLVELLTILGLDTGFSPEELELGKHKLARAGLEFDLRDHQVPYIVKNPWFCDYANEVINRKDIRIDHVFVPIRNLQEASLSREFVQQDTYRHWPLRKKIKYFFRQKAVPGGLVADARLDQEKILSEKIYKLLLALSGTSIDVTFLQFPRIVHDAEYLFGKLKPLLGDMPFMTFAESFGQVAKPELVNCFSPANAALYRSSSHSVAGVLGPRQKEPSSKR